MTVDKDFPSEGGLKYQINSQDDSLFPTIPLTTSHSLTGEVTDEKPLSVVFEYLYDECPDVRNVAKTELHSLMKFPANYSSFMESLALFLMKLSENRYTDEQNCSVWDILAWLLDPSSSAFSVEGNSDVKEVFLENLLPHLPSFFEYIVVLFSHPDECFYKSKATILSILTCIYEYSGKSSSKIGLLFDTTNILMVLKDELQNGTDELVIRYEMQAHSEALSLETFNNFLLIIKNHNILVRRMRAFITANNILDHTAEKGSVDLEKSCSKNLQKIDMEKGLHDFYIKFKADALYILGTMASTFTTAEEKVAIVNLEILPKLLSNVTTHGPFQERIEFLRIVCFLGGGDSIFNDLILETDVINTFSDLMRNFTGVHEKTEILWHLNVLFSNVHCRDAFFQSGLVPDIVEMMRRVDEGETKWPYLGILQPLTSVYSVDWITRGVIKTALELHI